MNDKMSLIKKYYLFSKERFPIPGVTLYAGSLISVSYCFTSSFLFSGPMVLYEFLLGFAVVFFVLLHLRIFDEHKDYEKDTIAHPDRMLSKGLITLRDLRKLLYLVISLEFFISLYLGLSPTIIWAAIMAWSLLMLVEFFAPEFLGQRLGLYLISHQLLVPIIILFGISLRHPLTGLSGTALLDLILFLAATMGANITYEIARKTWSKEREHEHADSYTKEWGNIRTVAINQSTAIASAGLFIYLFERFSLSIIYIIIVITLYSLFLLSGLIFLKKPETKNSKIVESAGIIFMLGLFIASSVAFFQF